MRHYLIDLDGTLYAGVQPLPHAREFIDYLNEHAPGYLLLTNCPSHTAASLREKLAGMGISVPPERIATSGQAAADYLAGCGAKRVFLVGGPALERELLARELEPCHDNSPCDYVLVGHDPGFCYEKLKLAMRHILGGAAFVCTNVDAEIPSETGPVPHSGALAAAVSAASGAKPVFTGKPEARMLEYAKNRLHAENKDLCIIGDRLDTDIAMGAANGIDACLMMTGVTTGEMLENSRWKPTYVYQNLRELLRGEQQRMRKIAHGQPAPEQSGTG